MGVVLSKNPGQSLLSCIEECTVHVFWAGMCCCECHTCKQRRFSAAGLLVAKLILCRAPTRGSLARDSVTAAPCRTKSGSMKRLPGCDLIPYLLPDLQGRAHGRSFVFLQHNCVLKLSAALPWGYFCVCGGCLGAGLLSPVLLSLPSCSKAP